LEIETGWERHLSLGAGRANAETVAFYVTADVDGTVILIWL